MAKAIITILGTIGGNRQDNLWTYRDAKATYKTNLDFISFVSLESQYTNTLPLLIEVFGTAYDIIPIATKDAKTVQTLVLEAQNINTNSLEKSVMIADDDYYGVFQAINQALNQYDEVIFDVSHGFRHLPIMATIALIAQNLVDTHKITHILFAKEIEQFKEYEIIDLAEYLDIATISYALASFTDNYTIAKSVKLRTQTYNDLLAILHEFSQHILANSLLTLFEKNLPRIIIDKIDLILESDTKASALLELLTKTRLHLINLDKRASQAHYKRLYFLGKQLLQKGYLLNAITILNEALPLYVITYFKTLNFINDGDFDPYEISSAMSKFIEDGTPNNKIFKGVHNAYRCTHHEIFDPLGILQTNIKKIRNDLAHAHGVNAEHTIQSQIEILYKQYEELVEKQDIASKLTIKVDVKNHECQYEKQLFEEYAEQIFKKTFPNSKLSVVKRIDALKKQDFKPEWNIPLQLSKSQQTLIDILDEYVKARNTKDKQTYRKTIDLFYQHFPS